MAKVLTIVRKPCAFLARRRGRKLAEDCEAFLSGRYLQSVVRDHGWAEPWVWLSTLAHGDRQAVEALAQDRTSAPDDGTAFGRYLAREVLAVLDHHQVSLENLQRRALVPVELAWRATGTTWGPKGLTGAVLAELERAAMSLPPGPPAPSGTYSDKQRERGKGQ
jgi:hypothetical protein